MSNSFFSTNASWMPDVVIEARVLAADVGVDAVELGEVDEVQAVGRREPHAPVDRAEGGVAAEQIERRPDAVNGT